MTTDGGPGGVERELAAVLRMRVAARLATEPADGQQRRARVQELIERELDSYTQVALREGRPVPDAAAEARIARTVRDALVALGGFQRWLDDDRVEDIVFNGCDVGYVTFSDGSKQRADPVAASDEELIELVRQIAATAGAEERRFDRGQPRLSVQLPDGSRLFAVQALCPRPSVTIRRHRFLTVTLAQLRELGTVDDRLVDLLTGLVLARRNIVISGGVRVGKTTLLRALAQQIPAAERLVTVEDAFELALDRDPNHPDTVALQARERNIEGAGEVPMAELVRWALRMSLDRLIVGEARGGEVLPMLMAMSQGNDGSLSTVHASSSRGALTRLATYTLQAGEQLSVEAANLLIAGAVHIVVHLGWDRPGQQGTRVVTSVREVTGADGHQVATNELFAPGPDGRARPAAPPTDVLHRDLLAVGTPGNLFAGHDGAPR
jgi:Flp pilus assembly CpaF family ATPase